MLAKSSEALSTATQAFGSCVGNGGRRSDGTLGNSVEKEYEAVVLGWPAWDERDWRGTLGIDPSSAFKMRVVGEVRPGGGAADAAEDKNASLSLPVGDEEEEAFAFESKEAAAEAAASSDAASEGSPPPAASPLVAVSLTVTPPPGVEASASNTKLDSNFSRAPPELMLTSSSSSDQAPVLVEQLRRR